MCLCVREFLLSLRSCSRPIGIVYYFFVIKNQSVIPILMGRNSYINGTKRVIMIF